MAAASRHVGPRHALFTGLPNTYQVSAALQPQIGTTPLAVDIDKWPDIVGVFEVLDDRVWDLVSLAATEYGRGSLKTPLPHFLAASSMWW